MVMMWQIGHALEGIEFPAQHWELGIWADYNGAGVDVRNVLAELPEGIYSSLWHVANQLGTLLLAPAGQASASAREPNGIRPGSRVGYRRVPGGRAALSA